jgi:hypothetical protein
MIGRIDKGRPGAALWGCCLCAMCAVASAGEHGGDERQTGQSTGQESSAEPQGESGPGDVVDRIFSPLDKAVSDINRDLNKGEATPGPVPDE